MFLNMYHIQDFTQWCKDMKFIFSWKKDFTCLLHSLVKTFFHQKINLISSNQRVNFFLLHKNECCENKKKIDKKQRKNVSNIFTSEDMENISLYPGCSFIKKSTSCLFFDKTLISM